MTTSQKEAIKWSKFYVVERTRHRRKTHQDAFQRNEKKRFKERQSNGRSVVGRTDLNKTHFKGMGKSKMLTCNPIQTGIQGWERGNTWEYRARKISSFANIANIVQRIHPERLS